MLQSLAPCLFSDKRDTGKGQRVSCTDAETHLLQLVPHLSYMEGCKAHLRCHFASIMLLN